MHMTDLRLTDIMFIHLSVYYLLNGIYFSLIDLKLPRPIDTQVPVEGKVWIYSKKNMQTL